MSGVLPPLTQIFDDIYTLSLDRLLATGKSNQFQFLEYVFFHAMSASIVTEQI